MASYPRRVAKSNRWAAPHKLRQLQYRSYIYELALYHYPVKILPMRQFEAGLSRQAHGFVTRLVSDDPIASIPKPEGDEVPEGYYEVAYLKNVFQNRGCALGFRIPRSGEYQNGVRGIIEWYCFEKSMQDNVDAWTVEEPPRSPGEEPNVVLLFEKVADLPKGPQVKKGTVKGNREHREWYQALARATHPRVKLKLTWRGREMDRKAELHMFQAHQSVLSAVVEKNHMEDEEDTMEDITASDRSVMPEAAYLGAAEARADARLPSHMDLQSLRRL